ncbi:addiction module toxin RelE [Spirochaetia bacterium]|nr:addiction module toxin RelE [Spirochaetia bacterium]
MDYEICYLPLARIDIREIFTYITQKLEAPRTAKKLRDEIDKAINDLKKAPYLCAVYRSNKIFEFEYRKKQVKNYSVFYVVKENTIEIHRVIYSARDIDSLLK